MLSNIAVQLYGHENAKIEEGMVRHMVLNSLRSYRQKFSKEYGEMIIACDTHSYWRKKLYPYYKANRKKAAEESEFDWTAIYQFMGEIRAELRDNFPYRVIEVESAEADDVIATLVFKFGRVMNVGEKILIISGDKDFIQLHTYGNVKQYDPVKKKFIEHDDPVQYCMEHVLKGDAGDGVPNVLCPDDYYVQENRQIRRLTQNRIDKLVNANYEDWDEEILKNYKRNLSLIDLDHVPTAIREKVMEQYEAQAGKGREKLMNYFFNHKLKHLLEYISDF